jgi:hypothetical protein
MSALYFISFFLSEDFSTTPWGLSQNIIDGFSLAVLITGILYAVLTKVTLHVFKKNIRISFITLISTV